MKMVRIEVVAPTSRVDRIVGEVGKLGVAHFININAEEGGKYAALTKSVGRSENEDTLQQLSFRINNLLKKMGEVPYPDPLPFEGETSEVLRKIEEATSKFEVDYARIENLIKEVSEERLSLERELRQLSEGYEAAKKTLSDAGVALNVLSAVSSAALTPSDKIKQVNDSILKIQRSLALVEMAGKLSSHHEAVVNDEGGLVGVRERVRGILKLHETVKRELPQASKELGKLDEVLKEVEEVVEKKLDAAGKLKEIQASAASLIEELEGLKADLTPQTKTLLGAGFTSALEEAEDMVKGLKTLTFGSPGVEEALRRSSKVVSEIRRGQELVETAGRYLTLDMVKRLAEALEGGKVEEIRGLLERNRQLLATATIEQLKVVGRALEILDLKHRIKELSERPSSFSEDLRGKAKNASSIHAYREVVDIELSLESVKKSFRRTGQTSVFEVWVKAPDVKKAVGAIQGGYEGAVVHVAPHEEHGEKPPTVMRNPRIAAAYEKLTAAYGLPNYAEIDPSFIMFLSFPIIFGIMFGDVGQGIIVLIGGLLIKPLFDKYKIKGELLDPLYKGRVLIISCGITAIIFGFLYGEFFGEFAWLRLEPLWFRPFDPHNPTGTLKLFQVALVVGMIQISFGIILDAVNKLLHHEPKEALLPLSWLWFYLSLSYIILSIIYDNKPIAQLGATIQNNILTLPTLGLFFILPFIGMLVIHFAVEGVVGGFSETLAKAIESISNTMSYSRILALGVLHAILSLIANGAGKLSPSDPIFWPIFIMATLLMIIVLEGIVTFAHTLRLHWVEWFSKYYKGDGVPFEGFRIERRFTAPA